MLTEMSYSRKAFTRMAHTRICYTFAKVVAFKIIETLISKGCALELDDCSYNAAVIP